MLWIAERRKYFGLLKGACGYGCFSLTMMEAKTAAREASLKDNWRTMSDYCV